MINLIKIIKNELITIIKDPGTLLIMIFAVFLYSLFYPSPYLTQVLKKVPIGIVDMDNSSFSRELSRNMNSNEYLNVVEYPVDVEQAKQDFYANKIKGYVVIPKDFENDIKHGSKSNIGMYVDSSYLIIYKQAALGINTVAMSYSAKIEVGKLMKKGLPKRAAIRVKQPFDFVQQPLFNPSGSYENYIYPLVLVLILQQT